MNLCDLVGSCVCHQWPGHSFQLEGVQLAVCARCTGIYLGVLWGLGYLAVRRRLDADYLGRLPDVLAVIALIAPMGLDGGTALLGLRASNNALRLVTGSLSGAALALILVPLVNFAPRMKPGRRVIVHPSEVLLVGAASVAASAGLIYVLHPPAGLVDILVLAGLVAVFGASALSIVGLGDLYASPVETLRKAPAKSVASVLVLVLAELWILHWVSHYLLM